MRYSKDLITKFTKEYEYKFNQSIKPEEAEIELNRLAETIRQIIPTDSVLN